MARGGNSVRIGIIGLGIVGNAIKSGFEHKHQIFVHDTGLGTNISDVIDNADLAYISVPTPCDERTGECDTRIVEEVLGLLPEGFSIVIKSTVIPGTTQRLHEAFPKLKIACSPEFLRTSTSIDDFQNQDVLVIGTHHEDLAESVIENHVKAGIICREGCFVVSPTQAELVKYAKNSFYSIKVIFANQFYDYCEELGEDWSAVKEIITTPQMQPIGGSHLEAISGMKRGFGGDCLPKDIRALFVDLKNRGIDYRLLDAVLEDNKRLRGD
jgi:UDPglucose 6-dehydrogenase